MSATLEGVERQPQARLTLEAALRDDSSMSHAYLFHGPAGTGKLRVALSFAATLIAEGAEDEQDARRRVLSEVHPDVTVIRPRGAADPGRGRARPCRFAGGVAAIRGIAARVRDRRRRPHERHLAERDAQDAGGAGAVRGVRADQLGARAIAGDDPVALPPGAVRPAAFRRPCRGAGGERAASR